MLKPSLIEGWAGYLVLVLLGLLGYFNAVYHPFVHDDLVFILNNPHISDLEHWREVFKTSAAADGLNTYYRPVLEIIYRLEYHFFGPHPWGFHAVNIILHIINGLLLFGLLQKLELSREIAWAVALLFLVHPVQTEAVSCISGISNLWMAFGLLLALHAYVNKWFFVSLVCFVAAFLGKEQAIMFFPLIIVIDCYRRVHDFWAWFMWILTIVALLGLRQVVTGSSVFKDIMFSPGELYLRLEAIPRVIGMDLRLIFFPFDLHYYRNTDILQSNILAWVMAVLSIIAVIYLLKRFSEARFGILLSLGWFLATLFPVLNIVPLINEYSFILTPEHFLYLPIVGILIGVAMAADHFIKEYRKSLLSVVVVGCLLLTWYQNNFWQSEIALFERMIQFEDNFARGHLLLANAYYFNGQPQPAEDHFERAYEIMSDYLKKADNQTSKDFYLRYIKEILFDWSQNEGAMGHWAQALDKLKQESAIDPKNPRIYNDIAVVYLHLGNKDDAISSLKQALQIDPSFVEAQRNLQELTSSGTNTGSIQ